MCIFNPVCHWLSSSLSLEICTFLLEQVSISNHDGNINTHDYRMLYSLRQHMWCVLCPKLWHCSNMSVNNDYFVNTFSKFVFQNVSVLMHCSSRSDFASDIAFAYYNMKLSGVVGSFLSMPVVWRVLKCPWTRCTSSVTFLF